MAYVDGFVVPVPKSNLDQYREISTQCGKVWMESLEDVWTRRGSHVRAAVSAPNKNPSPASAMAGASPMVSGGAQ